MSFYFDVEDNDRKSFQLPGAKPQYNPDRPGTVKDIILDLILDIPNKSFKGNCTIGIIPIRKGIRQITLDAVDLKIKSVFINKVSQSFDYDGKELRINLYKPTTEAEIKISIDYSVELPQRGIYFISPEEYYPDKPTQVWTQGEDEDSRYWFPCFDYPGQLATSEIKVRVPEQYTVISNGSLIAVTELEEEKIYHWFQQQIHPTYLMTLAVGEFAEIKDSWNNIPILYYVEKDRQEDAKRSMGKTPKMMEFLAQKYSYPYPYPKYAQVCVADFIFGGMENTSTTLLTDRCLLDERAAIDNKNTESLVLHELAHQWFGDLVVIKHWSHAWIKEGMASYAEVLWSEHEYGADDGAYYLLREARSYLEEDSSRYRRPIVTNVYREAIELYDRHLYEKGACVYHLIRGILGDELFDSAIATFVKDNAHQTVETVDLIRAIDKATGYNLQNIFDQYVFRGGHPDYKVAYTWDADNNLATLTVNQTQAEKELFDLKIPIAFGYTSDPAKLVKFKLRIYQKQQSFHFPLEQKPDFVSFDLGNKFLKTVTLEYPIPELKAQLKHDLDPISRIYAAEALAKKGGIDIIKTLEESLTLDLFWGVRLEAAKQLGNIKLNQTATALISGLSDKDARVRRAVVESLAKIEIDTSYQTLKDLLEKGDPSYYVEASAARSLGKIVSTNLKEKQAETIALLTTILNERSGWNEVVRSGAIGGLRNLKASPEAAELILKYTKLGTPIPLRLAAIRALGPVSTGQSPEILESILDRLQSITNETYFLTQVAITYSLGRMTAPKAIDLLQDLCHSTLDGRVKRKAEEEIAKLRKKIGSNKQIEELRQEIESIKQENQDLKSRLEKLEAQNN
ncbi:MAG: M1 family aminopeptidase [Prochloraceae cyanobacterium]